MCLAMAQPNSIGRTLAQADVSKGYTAKGQSVAPPPWLTNFDIDPVLTSGVGCRPRADNRHSSVNKPQRRVAPTQPLLASQRTSERSY